MAAGITFHEEIKQFREYLKSDLNEDAKRPLLYPLFRKLNKEKLKIESAAFGADVYMEGQIIVECKTSFNQWTEGFFQAMHYHKKYGLAYKLIMVIAHKYVGIWKVNQLPEFAVFLSHTSNPNTAPNEIGRINARKVSKAQKLEIQESSIYWLEPKDLSGDYFNNEGKSIEYETYEILNIIKNPGAERTQINTRNFIDQIELLKSYFEHPIDAVHCFYTIVAYWDITSVVSTNDYSDKIRVVGFRGQKHSEEVPIKQSQFKGFKKFVESRYIFTNEGSGLTVDYYFSRFDEVMARIDPEYVAQHGIFFTDINLSKFALWFAKEKLTETLNDQYIWFDPAGGSGNLISSWHGKLKHKIISELQPDLLRIIERRMKVDPWHVETGFTIIPKTSENKGLNFLDCDALKYVTELENELKLKNLKLDKPFAFLLNPPYKNTDENEKARESTDANYSIHKSILELTGDDAGKERYLAFLAQILNIARFQTEQKTSCEPIVMVFTPTSWLIPRPTYVHFRREWDNYFEYLDGFLITSNEFFKLKGKWPLAFTIWKYRKDDSGSNQVKIYDLTELKNHQLRVNWSLDDNYLKFALGIEDTSLFRVNLSASRYPLKEWVNQSMIDFKRDPTKAELKSQDIYGGLPLNDHRRKNKKTYGNASGGFIGFMDDNTPVRLIQDGLSRFSSIPDRVWLQLRPTFLDINLTKIHSGPTDKYGYCADTLISARNLFTWYCITKSVIQKYPTWANQLDIWAPVIPDTYADYWYAFCFGFVLAENRCVVTRFEANNPVEGAPEVFVDNPLSPNNRDSFWMTTLDQHVTKEHGIAFELVTAIKNLYRYWNYNYCHGQVMENCGLQDEPYFRYFNYPDFMTPNSGLIQIRRYAEVNGCTDLLDLFSDIQELTKKVKDEIYRLLTEEFGYFN